LIDESRSRFGQVLLLDCHSMPSFSANGTLANGSLSSGMIDFALGDRFGSSCAPSIIHRAEAFLRMKGYKVARNRPYAGGYITAHYGQPDSGVHALQIEVRRGLYMNEGTLRLHNTIADIKAVIRELLGWLVDLMSGTSLPRPQDALPRADHL
jgi:N-formylglutamate amidohydrolase